MYHFKWRWNIGVNMLDLLCASCTVIIFRDLHGLFAHIYKQMWNVLWDKEQHEKITYLLKISSEWHLLLDCILPGDKAYCILIIGSTLFFSLLLLDICPFWFLYTFSVAGNGNPIFIFSWISFSVLMFIHLSVAC